jgi:hypothetical protein
MDKRLKLTSSIGALKWEYMSLGPWHEALDRGVEVEILEICR